jgi:hypothetical protein
MNQGEIMKELYSRCNVICIFLIRIKNLGCHQAQNWSYALAAQL